MRWMPRVITPSLIAGLVTACGSAAPGTRADDMSAADHRAAAGPHDQDAAEHGGRYDPDAQRVRASAGSGSGDFDYGPDIYNPTASHLQTAGEHREIAEQHRQAARQLEAYEEEHCGRFPPATRGQCPLIGQVAAVEDIDGGVRIRFASGSNVEAARAHVQCHLAFARTQGREGMSMCPMYVDGARAENGPSDALDLVTDRPTQVEELRRRARAHLPR